MTPMLLAYLLLLAIATLVGFMALKKSREMYFMTVILLITTLGETGSFFAAKYYRNNLPVYHVLNMILVPLTARFFYGHIQGSFRKWIPWIAAACLSFAIFNAFSNGLKSFPQNALQVSSIMILILSTSLFIEMLDRPAKENLFKNPVFIICIAMLWVNLISFIFWLLYDYFLNHKISTVNLTLILNFSNYVYYILLLIAQILLYTKKTHGKGNAG